MTGVQLIGKNAVLTRYEKFDAGSWALYQGKQFIVGGTGADSLDEWLTSLSECGSTATYTLRVYEEQSAPTALSAGSDYIACLNFKLVDMYEGYGIAGHSTQLLKRLGAIEEQLKGKDNDEDDGEDLNSVIMGWLNEPEKLGQIAGAIRMLMGGDAAPAAVGQTIAGIPESKGDDVERVAAALDILGKADPKIVAHLEKLAKLSQDNPALFKMITSQLDGL